MQDVQQFTNVDELGIYCEIGAGDYTIACAFFCF